jgi:Restriction endonuclease
MKWQEYQDAVSELYSQLDSIGTVSRNIRIPDKTTGQLRQVDTWVELKFGDHICNVLIDAKKYQEKLDIKDIEEVLALSNAVRANKAIIVTPIGWTKPAEIKASFELCDLRILTIEEALDLLVPDKWEMCPHCNNDCIVMDQSGFIEKQGLIVWWLAGQCRECRTAKVHCQDCGGIYYINIDQQVSCNCDHLWTCTNDGIYSDLYTCGREIKSIDDTDQLKLDL